MKNQILKYTLVIFAQFFLITATSCAASYRIFKTREAKFISEEEAFDDISQADVAIVGETHYQQRIQVAEAWVMQKLSLHNPNFQMAWEFFNYNDQGALEESYDDFVMGNLSGSSWIAQWFPSNSSDSELYLPMFEVTAHYSQKVIGTNAPRNLKSKLMSGGRILLETDQEIWPFTSHVPDAPDSYLMRFEEAMGGHVDSQTLEKYYLAQYYTDAYMANAIQLKLVEGPVMMVVGHFHSDYGHGLPFYLKELGVKSISNIRIVDNSNLSSDELNRILEGDADYGMVGDYIIVID